MGLNLAEDYTSPGEYTGELIGVEYLYSQTNTSFEEDFGADPDSQDGVQDEDLKIDLESDEGFEDVDLDGEPLEIMELSLDIPEPLRDEPPTQSQGVQSHVAESSLPEPIEDEPATQSQLESLGPDGRPGYDHVVRLANSLVDLRHEGFITQQKVDEIVTLWDKLSEFDKGALIYPARHRDRLMKGRFKVSHSVTNVTPGADSLKRCFLGEGSGPAQWPNASRLVKAVCLALCRIYPAGQTVAGVKVNRWAVILRNYRIIRDVVLDSPRLMAETRLQLFELNHHTLSQWHNARKRRQEKEVLEQGIQTFTTPLVASEPLPPVLFKHPQPVRHGHQAYEFNIPVDASGQAVQRVRGQPPKVGTTSAAVGMPAAAQHAQGQPPPVQEVFAVSDPARLLQATDTATIAEPPATPPGPKVPRTTAWRRRKAAEAAAAQGATPKKRNQTEQYICQKCGQPKTKEFGHSRFGGAHFCAKSSGKTVEQWMEEMRRGQK
ncbi:uncharacterized protein LOC128028661 [Carassius gibelio]|nr:uncharacterized protein LOC128028661 [Carassius gibelio]